MSDGRTLQIFRDGNRREAARRLLLPAGAEANLITLREMTQIVREDSQFSDLRKFIFKYVGLENKTLDEQIKRAFEFCRDEIVYQEEKTGFETIADFWSCQFVLDSKGDCAIKSLSLATMLSYLNLKPFFTALRQLKNADFFNHVFVSYRYEGKTVWLDPTPPEFVVGKRLKAYSSLDFHIFR